MEHFDFGDICAASQRGDDWAARRLFERFQPQLLRYLRFHEPRMADDLAGEVWMAVAGSLRTFEGDEAGFRSWIFTIARRRVVDHRRRSIRRRTETADPHDLVDVPEDADDPAVVATDHLSGREAVELLARHLSAEQTEVLLLRVMVGLDTATVARMLQRSDNWVRVTQHRALNRLAHRLRPELEPVA
jgi:RNA polymerase sigma-70 factor (ECF subfamily)